MGRLIFALTDPGSRLKVVLIALAVASFFLHFRAEKTLPGEGTGGDGSYYALMIREFHKGNTEFRFVDYRLSRFAPCWCVAKTMRFFRIAPSNANIVQFMNLWNWGILLLAVWAAMQIASALGLSADGKSLLLVALFVNYPWLKMAPFYPVLFDTTGAAVGLWVFAAYLRRMPVVLLAVSFVGMLSWPTTVLLAVPLVVLYPFRTDPSHIATAEVTGWGRYLAAVPLVLLAALAFLVVSREETWAAMDAEAVGFGFASRQTDLLWVSLGSIGATSLAAMAILLRASHAPGSWLRWRGLAVSVAAAGGLLVAVRLARSRIDARYLAESTVFDSQTYLDQILFFCQTRPFNSLVCHLIYLGPALLLGIWFCRSVARRAHAVGPGAAAIVLIALAFSLDVETRRVLQILILPVPLVVKVLDERGLSRRLFWWVLGASVLWSKAWLTLNVGDPVVMKDRFTDRYFWSHGPWMSHEAFLAQAGVVAATAAVLYSLLLLWGRTRTGSPPAGLTDPGEKS